jgi:3-keto-5-aminohexanoate cleavage enzyme
MEPPVLITVAPTGAEVTRDQNPNVPYTPEEIAREAIAAANAGAHVVHLHVRNEDGTPASDKELFSRTIDLIRDKSEILTMVSTGGAVWMPLRERIQGIYADPDVVGIEVGSLNFGGEPFVTSREDTLLVANEGIRRGKPFEIEAFDVGQVAEGASFIAEGVIPKGTPFNLVLGVPGGMPASPLGLQAMIAEVPEGSSWCVTAVGRFQTRMLALAMSMETAAVRVGFEDNVYLRKGVLAQSNAELVEQIRGLAELLGRRIADPEDARAYFGL